MAGQAWQMMAPREHAKLHAVILWHGKAKTANFTNDPAP
jgi:hypothetical protein